MDFSPPPQFTNKDIYIDLRSGSEMKAAPSADKPQGQQHISYATAYPDSSGYFQWFVQYFGDHGIIPRRQIEYLKTDQNILISYYEKDETGLANSLAILDQDGQLLECILLEDRLTGIGKDTFFVFRNKAIFVSQKNTLNIYDL